LPTPALRLLLRRAWEEQQRFPLRVVHALSQQFAAHGLQFFKVNKTVTHVSVARPHYLDLGESPVSESIRRIVEFIEATPGCTRKRLLGSLAPAPAPAPLPVVPPPAVAPPPAEPASTGDPAAAPASTPVPVAAPEGPKEPQPTPEQTALISDLHWLIHQGHVIEFANGRLETAKKPKPKPVPPSPPAAPAPAPMRDGSNPPGAAAADVAEAPVQDAVENGPSSVLEPAPALPVAPVPTERQVTGDFPLPPAPAESEPPADEEASAPSSPSGQS